MDPWLRLALFVILLPLLARAEEAEPASSPGPGTTAEEPPASVEAREGESSGPLEEPTVPETAEAAPSPTVTPTPEPTPRKPPVEASKGRIENFAPDAPERLELLKVQIALDNAMFRPGKLDGLPGEFTQKVADRYLAAQGLPPGLIDTSHITEPLTDYTVTEADMEFVGRLASGPAAQSKLSSMPYRDAWELVAEKFHCDLNYLKALNPDLANEKVGPGTSFRVPNVSHPFSMQSVIDLNRERKAAEKAAKEARELAAAAASPAEENSPQPSSDPSPTPEAEAIPKPTPERTRLVLLREPRLIEVYRGDKMIGCFPCTPGSSRVPVPTGTWKITSNILMPYFRYDKSVLRDGTRSANAYMIPPGPNNYVGIVWMGINRRSVGIHGTNSPDRIGRNQSSGCIRLANWDAWEMTQLVEKGTPVEVR